ncbi:hypothetical protein [Marinobacterium stanieri]|uniref:hypothetical protein n=1 Tax=Marinobacterium stanieri TaxID=49186 RepID=UPI001115A35E|nr:hypothetical protein [Marinobacterium stanieri]
MNTETTANADSSAPFDWDQLKTSYNPRAIAPRVPANYRRNPNFKACSGFERITSPAVIAADAGDPTLHPYSPDAIRARQVRDRSSIELVDQLWFHIQRDGLNADQIRQCIQCRFAHRGPDHLIGVPVVCERGRTREAWNIPFHREE